MAHGNTPRTGLIVAKCPRRSYHDCEIHKGLLPSESGIVLTLQLLDDITWLSLQTLGAPVVHTMTSNMSCEFVRPCG